MTQQQELERIRFGTCRGADTTLSIPELSRIDDEHGGHVYTLDGLPVPSVSRILDHGEGSASSYTNAAIEAGRIRGERLHTMIVRALCGGEVAPPAAGDEIGADAWARFNSWREWWAEQAAVGDPFVPAYLEQPVWGEYYGAQWAGTIDAIGGMPSLGIGAVLDWKPRMKRRYKLQLTAYAIAAEQRGLCRLATPAVVVIPKPPERPKLHRIERLDAEWFDLVERYYYDNGELT